MRYYFRTPDGVVHERAVEDGWLAWNYACGAPLGADDEEHDGPATCSECDPKSEPVTADDSTDDGWPEGYTHQRSGAYVEVTAPDGSQVDSGTPTGKWKGYDAAQEAAWEHHGESR